MILSLFILCGCTNERRINSLEKRQDISDCLVRLIDVKITCQTLYQGEPNSVALQNKISRCIKNRGYPRGNKSCD